MTLRSLAALILLPLALGCQCAQVPPGLCFTSGEGCDAGAGGAGGGAATAALLASDQLSLDFGPVEVGMTANRPWVIRNDGQAPTGLPAVTAPPELTFTGCSTPIMPGGDCTLTVTFKPEGTTSNPFIALPAVTAAPGGLLSVNVTAKVLVRLTVVTEAAGIGGRVSTLSGGISCPSGCTELFEKGSSVALNAQTQNGSATRFIHWAPTSTADGGPISCKGSPNAFTTGHDCVLEPLTQHTNVAAKFAFTTNNLAFVSSVTFSGNLGGWIGADAKCNQLATAAGINNADNNGFIAWLSTPSSPALTRIPLPGGFERMDGFPFAASRAALANNELLLPLYVDEQGNHQSANTFSVAWTGTNPDGGAAANHCGDWTSMASGMMGQVGKVVGGPGQWTSIGDATCSAPARLYCLQITSSDPIFLPPPPSNAKIIYYTSGPGFVPNDGGRDAADAYCMAHNPGPPHDFKTFVAFISTNTESATSRLTFSGAPYYRLDGLFVGYQANLGFGAVAAVPWVSNDKSYASDISVWTGATAPYLNSTNESCANWTSTTGTGRAALINSGPDWFNGTPTGCTRALQLLCVEP